MILTVTVSFPKLVHRRLTHHIEDVELFATRTQED
jgi:hypothetical protein